MAMQPNLGDRERDKFVETADGDTAVRVVPIETTETDNTPIDVKLDEQYRLQVLNNLRSLNQTMLRCQKILEAIASE
jgi:hypothetical protein